MRYCPACRREVQDKASECPHCGVVFAKGSGRAPKSSTVPTPEDTIPTKTESGGLSVVLVLLVLIFAGFGFKGVITTFRDAASTGPALFIFRILFDGLLILTAVGLWNFKKWAYRAANVFGLILMVLPLGFFSPFAASDLGTRHPAANLSEGQVYAITFLWIGFWFVILYVLGQHKSRFR